MGEQGPPAGKSGFCIHGTPLREWCPRCDLDVATVAELRAERDAWKWRAGTEARNANNRDRWMEEHRTRAEKAEAERAVALEYVDDMDGLLLERWNERQTAIRERDEARAERDVLQHLNDQGGVDQSLAPSLADYKNACDLIHIARRERDEARAELDEWAESLKNATIAYEIHVARLTAALTEMREVCARVAEREGGWRGHPDKSKRPPGQDILNRGRNDAAKRIAAAIRALPLPAAAEEEKL